MRLLIRLAASGFILKLPDAKQTFLVSEGRGGEASDRYSIARLLLHCGASVFVYDYRGYGESQGMPSIDGVCNDAIGAYDFLVQREHIDGSRIIAYGQSFGSGVTGQLVLHRQLGGVILQSGISSLPRASKDALPWLNMYPDSWFPSQRLNNEEVFRGPHPPLLIVHGAQDKLVSPQNAKDLYAAACPPKTLLLLPDGTHGSFGKGNMCFTAINRFLQKLAVKH